MESTRETTMMSDLPADLVEEILYRVPAASLKRLRSTCKRWNALFKDRRFTEKHFRKAPKQPRVLMLQEYRLCLTSIDLNFVPPSIKFSLTDSPCSSNSEHVDIVQVFHSDGLLLCITRDNRAVVWNPCLGETRWIHHKNVNDREPMFAFGYEDNQSCRSYKILMFWGCYETGDGPLDGVEIYEFSSNSWRVVDATSCFTTRFSGVALKGNTYWISYDYYEDVECLVRFDFTRERFIRSCFPSTRNRGYMALSVVREEQLSVLNWKGVPLKLEMWVTNNIDEADLSWSKYFALDNIGPVFTSLIIDEEKKVALCCESYNRMDECVEFIIGEELDEYSTEIQEPWLLLHHPVDGSWWPFIFNYVPSLVKIQKDIETDEPGIESSLCRTYNRNDGGNQ